MTNQIINYVKNDREVLQVINSASCLGCPSLPDLIEQQLGNIKNVEELHERMMHCTDMQKQTELVFYFKKFVICILTDAILDNLLLRTTQTDTLLNYINSDN